MDGATTDARAVPLLRYDGRIGELYRIFLVNLLLTVVTLGVFRFWAVTRMRRYMWSRVSVQGERFEYDGTGGQLFVGFLLAGLILVGMGLAAGAVGYALELAQRGLGVLAFALLYLAVIVLALAAPFSAQRYRLGHTVWCGIRGGMQGSAVAYGLRSFWYLILCVLTLYQLAPWASLRLLERRINASFLGTLGFSSRGRPGQLYVRFLLTFLAVIALGAALAALVYAAAAPAIAALLMQPEGGDPGGLARDPETQRRIASLAWIFVPAYLAFFIGASLISCFYAAFFYRHVAGHTRLGGLRFGSDVGGAGLLGLAIANLLILLVTLGFGMPIVIHRNARFLTAHLTAAGSLDAAALGQSDRPVPRFSEGMFQQLDAGSGFV